MKAGAVPLLIELLKDRDLYVRAFAAGVLMYIGMELEGKELCLKDGTVHSIGRHV
jgi:HEAT repeat protein